MLMMGSSYRSTSLHTATGRVVLLTAVAMLLTVMTKDATSEGLRYWPRNHGSLTCVTAVSDMRDKYSDFITSQTKQMRHVIMPF